MLVVGGGLGGVAAALAAAERGADVVLVEDTAWLGGQLTSQAVPLDEHPWIERFGATARYRRLRDGIRAHYRAHYPLTAAARAAAPPQPGLEPRERPVARAARRARGARGDARAAALERPAARAPPARRAGALVQPDRVCAVAVRDLASGEERVLWADVILDATETGDLLPLCGAEPVTGFESREETGEPHAPAVAQPLNMQAVSACFAIDHLAGEDHTVERPDGYERWKAHRPPGWPEGRLSFLVPDPRTNEPVARTLRPNPPGDPAAIGPDLSDPTLDRDLWLFRRIVVRGARGAVVHPDTVGIGAYRAARSRSRSGR